MVSDVKISVKNSLLYFISHVDIYLIKFSPLKINGGLLKLNVLLIN